MLHCNRALSLTVPGACLEEGSHFPEVGGARGRVLRPRRFIVELRVLRRVPWSPDTGHRLQVVLLGGVRGREVSETGNRLEVVVIGGVEGGRDVVDRVGEVANGASGGAGTGAGSGAGIGVGGGVGSGVRIVIINRLSSGVHVVSGAISLLPRPQDRNHVVVEGLVIVPGERVDLGLRRAPGQRLRRAVLQ